jgi:hypothetical protein
MATLAIRQLNQDHLTALFASVVSHIVRHLPTETKSLFNNKLIGENSCSAWISILITYWPGVLVLVIFTRVE